MDASHVNVTESTMSMGSECSICLDALDASTTYELECGHLFHAACLDKIRESITRNVCPLCRHPLPAESAGTTQHRAWETWRSTFKQVFVYYLCKHEPYLCFLCASDRAVSLRRAVAFVALLSTAYALAFGAAALCIWSQVWSQDFPRTPECQASNITITNTTLCGSSNTLLGITAANKGGWLFVLTGIFQCVKIVIREFATSCHRLHIAQFLCHFLFAVTLSSSCLFAAFSVVSLVQGLSWLSRPTLVYGLGLELMGLLLALDWLVLTPIAGLSSAMEDATSQMMLAHGVALLVATQHGSCSFRLFRCLLYRVGYDFIPFTTSAMYLINSGGAVITIAIDDESHMRVDHHAPPPQIHPSVACDVSGMLPIVGHRYHLIGYDYDLCEAEFLNLEATAQSQYERIAHPGAPREPMGHLQHPHLPLYATGEDSPPLEVPVGPVTAPGSPVTVLDDSVHPYPESVVAAHGVDGPQPV